MARIGIPDGDGPEIVRVWSLQPEMSAGLNALTDAVHNKSVLPPRERECVRMRIAQINDCPI
jgi:alkylhydroperoxidase family enzyme